MAVLSEQLMPHIKGALLYLVMPVTRDLAMSGWGSRQGPQRYLKPLCYHKHLAKAKLHTSAYVMVIAIAKRSSIPQELGLQYQIGVLKE